MSIVDQNVNTVIRKWKEIRSEVTANHRRALNRGGSGAITATLAHLSQVYTIKAKILRDKKIIKAKVYNDEYVITLAAKHLNVRYFAVKEKWMSVSKDKSVSKINKNRRKESRRRNRVKVWQYSVIKGKWVTLSKAFTTTKSGKSLLMRDRKTRLPIRSVYGLSVGTIMIEPAPMEVMRSTFVTKYRRELERLGKLS